MPRLRGSEVPQRPSPTPRAPGNLRTSSSDSDPLHRRPLTERSPRLGDRRSPRGTQSDPPNQKKLGTRITDLETQLVQAQHELKSLKQQLASTEAAKKRAQEELHKKDNKKPAATRKVLGREKPHAVSEIQNSNSRDKPGDEVPEEVHRETDVFEVPVEEMLVKPGGELSHCPVDDEKETKSPRKPFLSDELASKSDEINQLRAIMEEKEKDKQEVIEENETLTKQLEEAKSEIASAQSKKEEMTQKLGHFEQELEASKANEARLKEKLLEVEAMKESLEIEMKKMKVQTEQWRKAADAAASVLAGGVEVNSRVSERCDCMDNHFNGIFEPHIDGYGGGYHGSSGAGDDDAEDGFGGGKKRGSGIRMLGDLWKKKGQK